MVNDFIFRQSAMSGFPNDNRSQFPFVRFRDLDPHAILAVLVGTSTLRSHGDPVCGNEPFPKLRCGRKRDVQSLIPRLRPFLKPTRIAGCAGSALEVLCVRLSQTCARAILLALHQAWINQHLGAANDAILNLFSVLIHGLIITDLRERRGSNCALAQRRIEAVTKQGLLFA